MFKFLEAAIRANPQLYVQYPVVLLIRRLKVGRRTFMEHSLHKGGVSELKFYSTAVIHTPAPYADLPSMPATFDLLKAANVSVTKVP